jgi:uncharacterized tellurite resistance protein B-like protein
MLDGLRQFIADVVSPTAHEPRDFDDTGYRLAATALLIHVVSIDGEPSDVEKRKLHGLIESRFGLDPGTEDNVVWRAADLLGVSSRDRIDLKHRVAARQPAVTGS